MRKTKCEEFWKTLPHRITESYKADGRVVPEASSTKPGVVEIDAHGTFANAIVNQLHCAEMNRTRLPKSTCVEYLNGHYTPSRSGRICCEI